jgi:DNA invertase Pin-like site-specific DNA recombinase
LFYPLRKAHRACSNAANRDNEPRKEIKVNEIEPLNGFFNVSIMLIGYARVSTDEQNPDLQEDALKAAGCEKIIVDKVSGAKATRPGLDRLSELLRCGDTLVVWRLDRLGRSLKDLIEWVNRLEQWGVGLRSLQESIDTQSSSGKLIFHIFGALAEFERHLIEDRTRAGLAAARARGRKGGRPKSLDSDKRQLVVDLYQEKKLSVKQICAMMNISKPTLYAYVREIAG